MGVENEIYLRNGTTSVRVSLSADGTTLLLNGAAPPAGAPSGAAGGALAGTYPNPTLSAATWATFSGVPMHPAIYYLCAGTIGLSTVVNANAQVIYTQYLIGKACTLDRIGVNVSVAGEAASVARLGLYADSDGIPGAKIADYGTVTTLPTGPATITISQAVTPGWYWTAVATQASPSTPPTLSSHQSSLGICRVGDSVITANKAGCYFEAGVAGALPATATPQAAAITSAVAIWLRAA